MSNRAKRGASRRLTPKTVHQMKVTLRNVKPPVWRRIEVRSATKLSELAAVLEGVMGWMGGHLHGFETPTARYGVVDSTWPSGDLDERKYRVTDVLPSVGSKMRWSYDFGDGWEHDIVVEAIEMATPGETYPVCITGRRACPPEDCGGPWGYGNLLAAIADPGHEDHADLTEWLGDEFDPEEFDADDATGSMRAPRPLAGW